MLGHLGVPLSLCSKWLCTGYCIRKTMSRCQNHTFLSVFILRRRCISLHIRDQTKPDTIRRLFLGFLWQRPYLVVHPALRLCLIHPRAIRFAQATCGKARLMKMAQMGDRLNQGQTIFAVTDLAFEKRRKTF